MIIRFRSSVNRAGASITLMALAACGNNGAPPYPPEPPQAVPGIGATGGAVPLTAGLPAGGASPATRAAAGGTAPAPPDPHFVYDLREKCGEDARRWYEHFHGAGVSHSHPPAARHGFTSHYNTRSNECFALTSSISSLKEVKSRQAEVVEVQTLANVLENKEVGSFLNRAAAATPAECHVARQICNSREEWESLTAPYMSD